jgi:pimeloyl-ACP methyl ester carboxylesterase
MFVDLVPVMVSSDRMRPSEALAVDDSRTAGPVVVGLPMFNLTRAVTADAFRPAFAGAGLREIYPDLPGHGDSPAGCRPDSESVLATVCAWLEAYVDGPVLLAGGSYGAYLAAGIARRRPDLVRGLLLVCPAINTAPDRRDLPGPAMDEAPAGWLDEAPAELRPHFDMALGRRTPAVVRTVLAALGALDHGDEEFRAKLRGGPGFALLDEDDDVPFDGPVSVIAGRHDRVAGYADQFRVMRRYPRGTYAAIDEAGHYLPFEQPELLRALSQAWLRRALRPS